MNKQGGEMTELKCANCGATDDFWAWYGDPVRQTIEVWLDEKGELQYDYTGITKGGEEGGEDEGYTCGACGAYDETLEGLLGLPPAVGAKARANIDTRALATTVSALHNATDVTELADLHEQVHGLIRLLHVGPQDYDGDHAWLTWHEQFEEQVRKRVESLGAQNKEGSEV